MVYFSIIMRTENGFDITPAMELPDSISISRHYENLRDTSGELFVDAVYRNSKTEAVGAANKVMSEQPNPF